VGNIGNERRVGLFAHLILAGLAKDCTSDRSQFRSSIASVVQSPVRKLPFFAPRGAPGLRPPCRRHRLRPRRAGRWHGVPPRLKTAKALGLTVPLIMQMTANEVIE
jgi:hypothetical protein